MTAGAAASPLVRMRDRERRTALAFLAPSPAFLLVAFVTPLAVSLAGPHGLSFAAYTRLLGTQYYRGVVWNSLRIALLTTVFALAIAYPAAFAQARARHPAQRNAEQSVPAASGERHREGLRLDHALAQRRAVRRGAAGRGRARTGGPSRRPRRRWARRCGRRGDGGAAPPRRRREPRRHAAQGEVANIPGSRGAKRRLSGATPSAEQRRSRRRFGARPGLRSVDRKERVSSPQPT